MIAEREVIVFANPWVSYFIPRGEATRDEIRFPRVCNSIGDYTKVLLYLELLNKKDFLKNSSNG